MAPPSNGLPGPLKWLLGCSLLAGGFLVATLLLLTVAWFWLMGTGRQFPSQQAVGSQARGVLVFDGDPLDEGVRSFLSYVIEQFGSADQRRQAREAPDSMRWIYDLQSARQDPDQAVLLLTPRDLTVVLDREEDGSFTWGTAFNPRQTVRLIRLILDWTLPETSDEKLHRASLQGHTFYHGAEEGEEIFTFGTVDGTVVVSRGLATARRMVDGLLGVAPAGGAGPSPLVDQALAFEGPWDLRAFVDNRDGALSDVVEDLHSLLAPFAPAPEEPVQGESADAAPVPPPPLLSEAEAALFRSMRAGLDVTGPDLWRIRLEPELAPGASTVEASLVLTRVCPFVIDWAARKDLRASCAPEVSGTSTALNLEILGWREAWEIWLAPPAPEPTPSLDLPTGDAPLLEEIQVDPP